jgi:hypothetical protein
MSLQGHFAMNAFFSSADTNRIGHLGHAVDGRRVDA